MKENIKEITTYQCPDCGDTFEHIEDAINCCFDSDCEQYFECPNCSMRFQDEEDAINCCKPSEDDIQELTEFKCVECNKIYNHKVNALNCYLNCTTKTK